MIKIKLIPEDLFSLFYSVTELKRSLVLTQTNVTRKPLMAVVPLSKQTSTECRQQTNRVRVGENSH